jgi:pimeloyl-ACP methyl ester carboxylesterase
MPEPDSSASFDRLATRFGRIQANGLSFHYAAAGSGPLVLLLHGFPEFWYGWRRQIPALASAGYRVVAPDLRGYNKTDRPPAVRYYALPVLVDDVIALIAAFGESRARVVAHDWGGAIAWHAAMQAPDKIERLAILNAPHPAAYQRELRRFSSQLLRSAYAFFFQLPAAPEALLRAANFALLRRILSRGPASGPADVERYIEGFSSPGALTAPLHYYRAALRFARPPWKRISTPTLVLWGDRDPYLRPTLADGLEQWVDNVRVQRFPSADHWLHHREASAVNRALIRFLRADALP